MLAFVVQWVGNDVGNRGGYCGGRVVERRACGRARVCARSKGRRLLTVTGSMKAASRATAMATATAAIAETASAGVTRTVDDAGTGLEERGEKGAVGKGGLERYRVRMAEAGELYTVADIRCEAFYGGAREVNYFAVRRREIFVAMRERVAQGNRCLVVLDAQGDGEGSSGGLVVGSCDVAFHVGVGGVRVEFGRGKRGSMYVSSMAVREGWRGRGLAQSLLRHVDEMVREFGVAQVFLHVEGDNCVALHVYRKCGFDVVAGGAPKWLAALAKKEHTLMTKIYR